jgi:hypothetical protein
MKQKPIDKLQVQPYQITNVIDYFQKVFDEAQKDVLWDWRVSRVFSFFHGLVAFILKAIAIFGGIAIAAGLEEKTSHIVGIMIAVAIGVDLLLQNFNRLLAIQDAKDAYKELFLRVVREHRMRLGDVQIRRAAGDEEGAKQLLVSILQELIKSMHDIQTQVEAAWKIANRAALMQLSMEQSKIAKN